MLQGKDLNASPLKHFVNATINQIKNALPNGFRLKGDIEFELSVVNVGDAKGGVDLRVVNIGGSTSKEETQIIKFAVTDKEPESDVLTEAEVTKILKEEGIL
jgi:hypothetical protein